MSTVRSGSTIKRPRQTISVNGSQDGRLWCSQLQLESGLGSSSATIEVPELLWDSRRVDLRDALVSVSMDNGAVDFVGYLSTDSATLTPDEDSVTLTAYSFTKWLSKVHVGQNEYQWETQYYFRYPKTQIPTGLTPALILRNLFDHMPQEYAAHVKLGDIAVLTDVVGLEAPDMTFRLMDYATAIQSIADLYGDVAIRERYESDTVYLDFYRVMDAGGSTVTLKCSQWSVPSLSGDNVQSMNRTETSTDLVTRVQGFGAYRRFMVSVKSAVEGLDDISQVDPDKQLQKGWNPALEALVLKNPKLARGGQYSAEVKAAAESDATSLTIKTGVTIPANALLKGKDGEWMKVISFTPPETEDGNGTVSVERGYHATTPAALLVDDTMEIIIPGIERVFRRFYLPNDFRQVNILKENCLRMTDGTYMPVQVWHYAGWQKRKATPEGTLDQIIGGVSPVIVLAEGGAKLNLEKGYFELNQPALVLTKSGKSGTGKIKNEYTPTVVGITFTYEDKRVPFVHDTGVVSGQAFFGFAQDGLTERWQKSELMYNQLGNAGFPLDGKQHGCVYINEVTKAVTTIPEGSALIDRNDYPLLKSQSEQILRERHRRARSYDATIPYFDRGFKLGYRAKVRGEDGYINDQYKVTGVTFQMSRDGDHSTSVTVDNVKPPHRQRSVGRAR